MENNPESNASTLGVCTMRGAQELRCTEVVVFNSNGSLGPSDPNMTVWGEALVSGFLKSSRSDSYVQLELRITGYISTNSLLWR